MISPRGRTFGLVGGLAAFPRRLAAREVQTQGGDLQRGISRRTTHLVFGRKLLDRGDARKIETRFRQETERGRKLLSENGFLRALGLLDEPAESTLCRQSILDQSRLPAETFDLLALFDAFEHDHEPVSFRDLILARKYVGLIASGATWSTIARSVRRSDSVASLTALSLHAERADTIYARSAEGYAELDGQVLLPLVRNSDEDLDGLFAEAEEAEEQGRHADAAELYRRCIAIDPTDATPFFNRSNCLAAVGMPEEARVSYLEALKRDPQFVEAWFNLADLASKRGDRNAARRSLAAAIALDGDYSDAIFNLASLEYDAGDLVEARKWWVRYLDLDDASEWAQRAKRGIQLIDLQLTRKSEGAA